MMVQMMGMYEGREQLQRDEALRSCGMAAQTIMLAAKALGYDTCPMAGFDPEAVGRLINLPPDHVIGAGGCGGQGAAAGAAARRAAAARRRDGLRPLLTPWPWATSAGSSGGATGSTGSWTAARARSPCW